MARMRRLGAGAVFAALVAAMTTTPSGAASSQTPQEARARLASLNNELSLLVQRYDVAVLKLKQTRSALVSAAAEVERAQSEFASASANLNAKAILAYETGGASDVAAVLELNSVQDASAGAQYLATIAQSDADAAEHAQVARSQAQAAQTRLSSLVGNEKHLLAELTAERAQISSAIASQVAVIHQIERRVHHNVVPSPTGTPAGGSGGGGGGGGGTPPPPPPGQIDALIYSIWGSGKQGDTAECIADRESGDNPFARSASGAAGLFQLMPFWWDGANAYGWKFDPYDARQNAVHAHAIWKARGWAPWGGGC